MFEGDGGRAEVPTPAISPSCPFGLSSGRHGSQCSNRAVGGQTPTLPLNPAKCAVSQPAGPLVRLHPMKEILKSYGGTALVALIVIAAVAFAARKSAFVRNWFTA